MTSAAKFVILGPVIGEISLSRCKSRQKKAFTFAGEAEKFVSVPELKICGTAEKSVDTEFEFWENANTHGTKNKFMRTKKLLLTAALGAAVSTGAIAQDVFSVNVVGYVKLEIPNGLKMIANPLETANSTVAELFEGAAVAEGSIIYKFDPATGAYSINVFDFGEWSLPGQTLEPGEGAFFLNAGAPFEVTFVGEVRQGNLETPLPAGLSIVSSQVPQITSLDDPETGFPAVEGDTVYRFINETGAYRIHVFDFGEWSINPEIEIGESVFVSKVGSAVWARSFSVN